jgi:hypothetical protein
MCRGSPGRRDESPSPPGAAHPSRPTVRHRFWQHGPLEAQADGGNRTVDRTAITPPDSAVVYGFSRNHDIWHASITSSGSTPVKTGRYTVSVDCETAPPCTNALFSVCPGYPSLRRFRVELAWENQFNNTVGFAYPQIMPGYAAGFTIAGPGFDVVMKILPFGDRYKVFYGQLTNLKFKLAVTDLATNTTKIYRNTEGDCGGIDNGGFPKTADAASVKAAACRADTYTACMLNDRFAVQVDWANQYDGKSGRGKRVGTSGFFTFTDSSNYEVLTKFVDYGDRIDFFYSALSDLEYTIRVTDTLTGEVKSYHNPAGRFCGGLDNDAFPVSP